MDELLVLEHLPLQQGLRRIVSELELETCGVLEHLPLQQGLRHHVCRDGKILGVQLY